MSSISPTESAPTSISPPGRQLVWLLHIWNGLYIVSLLLTLAAVLWNIWPEWGWREASLVGLTGLQALLYLIYFAITHSPRRQLPQPWLIRLLLLSLGLWFIQWRLEASFWWIIWIQLAQIYTLLPLRLALPGAMLIFVITAGFENGFHQFSTISLPDKVGRHIPWVVFSMAFAFISWLVQSNQERIKLIDQLQAANQSLETARQQEVELATLRERERLARDLHDSLGHTLVTLSVQLEAVQRLYPVNPAGADSQIREMKSLTRTSLANLRHTLTGLRAPGLGDRPLSQALDDLCLEISRRTGLTITCQTTPEVDRLWPALTEALWRVTQEALMNVEKHAAARCVQVDLRGRAGTVTLKIADDGLGLPSGPTNRPGHFGLRGMVERIEGVGGILTLSSNDQGGTVIEATVPLIDRDDWPPDDT